MSPDTVAKLVDVAARVTVGVLTGKIPDAVAIADELLDVGLDLVGTETLRDRLSAAAAHRIDVEVDELEEEKLAK